MEKKSIDKIRFELYETLLENFGDKYKYFDINIKMYKDKPEPPEIEFMMNGKSYDEMKTWFKNK